MAIKAGIAAWLIYAAIAAFTAAAAAGAVRSRRVRGACFAAGFVLAATALAARWAEVRHVPLQSLFEVFLALGAFVWPLSLFARRYLGADGRIIDPLIAAALLFPAGFVFSAEPQRLPPALQHWLFLPHVAAYMLAYVMLFKAGAEAARSLAMGAESARARDAVVYRLVRFGFPLLTLGLILGAWWGKIAWGDYWSWDPKELWSLASWLVFVAYLHARSLWGDRRPRANAAIVLLGAAAIILTLLWVNLAPRLFGGMHTYAAPS